MGSFAVPIPLPNPSRATPKHQQCFCRNSLCIQPRYLKPKIPIPIPNPNPNDSKNQCRATVPSHAVTDDSVPVGHQSLHSFLYGGEKGSEVHSHESPTLSPVAGQDDGSSLVPFHDYVSARLHFEFAGVYAVYDALNVLQYVGFSRNVILSLKSHQDRLGASVCASVRVKAFTDKSALSRANLEAQKTAWIEQFGMPPGNSVEQDLWVVSSQGPPVKSMPEKQRMEYEDKKLKLRKAMDENLYDEVEGEDEDSRTRRLNLIRATERDDWSAIIDGQDKEAILLQEQETVGSVVSSPFEKQGLLAKAVHSDASLSLTLQNAERVLDEVRPYLIADGGNVEVVSVEDGVVSLRLQGACGTCPSSTTTMKMGIEKVMTEKFGNSLKEIVQVDQQIVRATVEAVNSHLDMLRKAIHGYGASVEVVSVEGENCHVKYNGPAPIGMGIQASIKDRFPDIVNVIFANP